MCFFFTPLWPRKVLGSSPCTVLVIPSSFSTLVIGQCKIRVTREREMLSHTQFRAHRHSQRLLSQLALYLHKVRLAFKIVCAWSSYTLGTPLVGELATPSALFHLRRGVFQGWKRRVGACVLLERVRICFQYLFSVEKRQSEPHPREGRFNPNTSVVEGSKDRWCRKECRKIIQLRHPSSPMKQQFQTLQAHMDLGVAQNQAPSAALQATLGQTQQLQSRMAEASGSRGDAPAQVPKDWAPQPWSGQHAA